MSSYELCEQVMIGVSCLVLCNAIRHDMITNLTINVRRIDIFAHNKRIRIISQLNNTYYQTQAQKRKKTGIEDGWAYHTCLINGLITTEGLWCLTLFSVTLQSYRSGQFYWWTTEYQGKPPTCRKSLTNFIT